MFSSHSCSGKDRLLHYFNIKPGNSRRQYGFKYLEVLHITMKFAKLLAVVLLTAVAFAQGRGPGGTPPDPQTRIQMRVSFLTTFLNLTDAQKASATTIFTDAYTASQTPQASLRSARQSLSDAVKSNNTGAIDQISATIGALNGQLTAIDSKAEAAFYALLTADQQAKYDTTPHGGPGFGGPGGPRGPRGAGGFGAPRY